LEYLLFVGYLVLFAWLVTKTLFFTATGLSKPQLVIIFLLKVIVGIFYGWMGLYYGVHAKMSDTWFYHHNSIAEYQLLGTDPKEYFTNLFHNPYENGVQNFLGSTDSYWNDLHANFFIKILSVFDIFSLGHYYINVIFYAFLSLFGPIAIYRVMTDIIKDRKIPVLLATFFVPSFFYWTSGIHKEGLIFVGISLIIYHIYFGTKEKKLGIKRISGILLGLLLLLILRNFIIVIIVPAVLAWILANRFPKYGLTVFISVYVFFGILFFTLRYIDPRLDFPQAVVEKQQAFIKLKGHSSIPIKELEPDAISFVKNIPQAVTLSALRPYPSDVRHLLSLAAALEIDLLFLLFIIFLIWRKKGVIQSKNTARFCIFFSTSLLLAIGFSVNNLGAIVRYRSIIIPLVIVLLAAQINWEKIGQFLFKDFKNIYIKK
jgi:hypothetical protein